MNWKVLTGNLRLVGKKAKGKRKSSKECDKVRPVKPAAANCGRLSQRRKGRECEIRTAE